MVVLFVILTFILFLTIDYFVQRAELRRAAITVDIPLAEVKKTEPVKARMPFPIDRIPRGVLFDPGHTWLQLEPSGTLRLGIDMLPVTALGEVKSVEMHPAGTSIRKGDPVVTLRRGRRSLSLLAPVDGVIEEINSEVQADPSRLHHNPFSPNWLYRMLPKQLTPALKEMFIGEEAVAWLWNELRRLYNLIATLSGEGALVGATLHDGGLPVEGFAEYLDDECWARFVDEFFVQGGEL